MHSQQSEHKHDEPGELIPFPFEARTKQVRQCAHALLTRSEKAAASYWERTLSRMGDRLIQLGLSQAEVDRQYHSFKREVEVEMARRQHQAPPPPTAS